jgi:hypothetical protein
LKAGNDVGIRNNSDGAPHVFNDGQYFSRLIFIDLQQSTEALDTSHDGKISRLVPAKGLTDVRRSLL